MTDPHGNDAATSVPAAADTGAIATMGLDLQEGRKIPRKQVFSWALWDWATQPFNSVILTFVFVPLYLTTGAFLGPELQGLEEGDPAFDTGIAALATALGVANALAALVIAVAAPIIGQRSDGTGRRKFWLGVNTGLLVLCMLALFFVQPSPGSFFILGISLVAIGSVFSEIAGVNYNAMLVQVSTPKTVGRVSGLGWGFGYLGGIVALTIVIVAQLSGWFGLTDDGTLAIRVVAVGCAVWTIIFAIPIFLNVPELPASPDKKRLSIAQSYGKLFRDIARLYRETPTTFWFLLASAVFRDGLAGVFTYGAVIAAAVYGFGFIQVVIFGIAANLVAGVSTIVSGRLDDRFGPRAIILFSLGGLVAAGSVVFLFRDLGDTVFWVGGLVLCLFVGPAQAASRSFLARVSPAGKEGEVFGLYATTGRAASPLSPALWATFIAIASAAGLAGPTAYGILGIVLVLAIGFVLMLFVKIPKHERA